MQILAVNLSISNASGVHMYCVCSPLLCAAFCIVTLKFCKPVYFFITKSQVLMIVKRKAFENGFFFKHQKMLLTSIFYFFLNVFHDERCKYNPCCLTHSLIYQFETVPNSKKLQTTTEMWLLKDFKIHMV